MPVNPINEKSQLLKQFNEQKNVFGLYVTMGVSDLRMIFC